MPDPCAEGRVVNCVWDVIKKMFVHPGTEPPPDELVLSPEIEARLEEALQQSPDTSFATRAVIAADVLAQSGLHAEALMFSQGATNLHASAIIRATQIQQQALNALARIDSIQAHANVLQREGES